MKKTMGRKRKEELLKQSNVCFYCGKKKYLTIDHVIPKSKDGSNKIENLVLACKTCNVKKADKMHFTKKPSIDFKLNTPAYWEH